MSLGMRMLSVLVGALATAEKMAMRDWQVYGDPDPRQPGWRAITRIIRCGHPRLVGPSYSDRQPVLKRGRRRTLALKLAQTVDWHDERANLYGCHPCPKCGEVRDRCAIKHSYGNTIECGACGDKRPVREWIG